MDRTSPLQPVEGSAGPSENPQTTTSPTPAEEPAPTLETLPTELLRSVADHLSVPQRSLLALTSKQTLFKLGLPSREEWQEISNSPFLPNFLGLHDARTFASRLQGTFNISSSRFVAAPDDLSCNVDCFSRCTTWNGNLILKTTLNYALSDDPEKMSKLVQLFQEDRTQEGGPAGGEKAVDCCCPHVRWTRELPDAFTPLSPARRPLKRVRVLNRSGFQTLAEEMNVCERCCTAYRCTEYHSKMPIFSLKQVVLESWRNLGSCGSIHDPMWLSQVTEDSPKSPLSAKTWKKSHGLNIANPNIVNSDIVSSDFVKMNPVILPAEMSSDIQTAAHTISTNPMDPVSPMADLRLQTTSNAIQTDDQSPSDSTETPEEHCDPPPTLQTLPAEMLLDIAEYLSPPQRVCLALARKSVLYAAGLPPSSAWRAWRSEVSDSPFLPWILRFRAARSFVDRNEGGGYLDNRGLSEYRGDGARVARRVGWSFCSWNGNLVMETAIGFDVVKNGPGATAAAVARLFRQHPDPSENPVGFPLEGPLDWCCPHVRWLEAFPHTVATGPRVYESERPKICDRCTTAYLCTETRNGSSRHVRFESRRVLGRCQAVTDPMWLSQATQDHPPKSELVAEEWKMLWPEGYAEPPKKKEEEKSPVQAPRWEKCVGTQIMEWKRAQAEGRLESPEPRMPSWEVLEDWPILLKGLDAWAVQR
ncbi:hypothetical protein CMUS01_04259 [Colletotrichum musicola]|uniref:F-box domain-containing protein n=1 Tax=Colletotrichum musicola TaxID=2175873 RepID=A0A8H6KYZ4_9PEZI|nr:hypothetical protein CMUS01_04259 [Colletotrichum musicola]